jgi:hypothetical protein
MTPILVFDIETIPDVAGIRRLEGLPATLSDAEVAEHAFAARREKTGGDFLPHHLQRIAAISCVFRDNNGFRVRSLGTLEDGEAALVQSFYRVIEKYTPQLVSWNGTGFDLPVLSYRALLCGNCATKYWDQGEDDREFKFNNYIGRYHSRHLDLMDLLALYQPRNNVPLDDLSRLAGFPGKVGVGGAQVWAAYQRGEIRQIREYCEADTVNTYLLYLRFQVLRGVLQKGHYDREVALLRETLGKNPAPHWREFLAGWKA